MDNNEGNSNNIETTEVKDENINISEQQLEDSFENVEEETENNFESEGANTSESTYTVSNNKKTNPVVGVVIVVAILAVILIVAFAIYKFVLYTPKNIFLNGINNVYSNIEKTFDDTKSPLSVFKGKSLDVTSSLNINVKGGEALDEDTLSMLNILNKMGTLTFNLKTDVKTSDIDLTLIAKNEDGNIDFGTYVRDSKVYIESKALYDKYIKIVELESLSNNKVTEEETKYLISKFKDSLLESLNVSNISTSNSDVKIDEKNVKLTKTTYSFDEKELTRITKEALQKIKADEKSVNILVKLLGKEKAEITSGIDNITADLLAEVDSDAKFEISVYTSGLSHNYVGYELSVNIDDTKMILNCFDYEDMFVTNFKTNEILLLNSVTKKLSENKYNTIIRALTVSMTIDTTIDDKSSKSTFELKEATNNLLIKGTYNTDYTLKDTDYSSTNVIDLNMSLDDEKLLDEKVTVKTTMKLLESLVNINTNNSIETQEITEDDFNSIKTKLTSNKYIISLMELLNY